MKVAVLIKNNEISSYPADLLVEGEVIKNCNIEFELEANKIDILIGKSIPSILIKRLREKGIIFFKSGLSSQLNVKVGSIKERYRPVHQLKILSDKKTTIHMGERDCSVQRKHQKLIEESPSPVLDEKTRQDLLNKTVEMVSKLNYEGVGTVEFIYDNGKFFFLEMNTRIQVEHPVSEVVTGIDIVKEQIGIAAKGYTTLNQTDIITRGHAIECRINAEDPSKNFQPSPGIISVCHQPSGFRTRVDGAIFQGCKITPYYDSLICKLICHGRNRTEAIQRTLRSLDEFVIEGVTTTIDLHKKIINHQEFINSSFDVNWLNQEKFY